MQRRLSRTELRRQRRYREAVDPTEWPLDYDAAARLAAIDAMPKGWRDLINEHGFTPVMAARQETASLKEARAMMQSRRERRQMQLAMGMC